MEILRTFVLVHRAQALLDARVASGELLRESLPAQDERLHMRVARVDAGVHRGTDLRHQARPLGLHLVDALVADRLPPILEPFQLLGGVVLFHSLHRLHGVQ